MLQFNSKLHKGKTQLTGGFKLPFCLNGASHRLPKWVNEQDTLKVESLIGQLFTRYLQEVENKKTVSFTHNENDDHKNPDLFLKIDDEVLGVQITQFVLREYLARFNQAKRICEKISSYITDIYTPSVKINIQISTPWDSDKVPKAPISKYKKLSKLIANSVSENIDNLKVNDGYLNYSLRHTEFKDIAEDYNLLRVPEPNQSNYFGQNNIYIDYGFDDILIFKEDIEETAKKIFDNKNNGNSEILIIWGDTRQYMNTDNHIMNALKNQFVNTTFKQVYFLRFANFADLPHREIFVSTII